MSALHSLADYTAAVGLIALGMMGWQLTIALCVGVVILYFISNLMGVAGQRVGVPFPVFSRLSFGIYGANIPALIRAIVAVAWYGIQTYLASQVIMILVLKVIPSATTLTEQSWLGLSYMGWICFLGLWVAQLIVLYRGMEAVRKLADFAGPAIWVAMIGLALWTLHRADWKIHWTFHVGDTPLDGGATLVQMAAAAFLFVALVSGPVLNFADFTRLARSEEDVIKGNRLGLLLNGVAFCVVSMIIALASTEVYGHAIDDPIVLLAEIDNITALLLAIVAVAIATAGINVILNFVAPAFDFAHIAPRLISFRAGGVITAVLSILVLPWKLYSNPVVVNQFLGGVGALMGPLFGLMMADYYLIRRAQVDPDSLFSDDPDGRYYYKRGTNMNSIYALVFSGGITLMLALLPQFSAWAPFSWPIGVLLGAGACLLVNRLRPNLRARVQEINEYVASSADTTTTTAAQNKDV